MNEQEISNRLKERLTLLSDIDVDVPYAAPVWQKASKQLYNNLTADDPFSFYTWPVVQHHLISGHGRETPARRSLELYDDWESDIRPVLAETYGDTLRAFGSDFARATITEQLLLATQFAKIADAARVNPPTAILEYGGGFGVLRHLLKSFDGKYVVCDLPVVSELQKFYLSAVGVDAETEFVSPVALPSRRFVAKMSSFVSLWALSETPLDQRGKVLRKVKSFSSVFIVYQNRWNEIDNESFFGDWKKETVHEWYRFPADDHSTAIVGLRVRKDDAD